MLQDGRQQASIKLWFWNSTAIFKLGVKQKRTQNVFRRFNYSIDLFSAFILSHHRPHTTLKTIRQIKYHFGIYAFFSVF